MDIRGIIVLMLFHRVLSQNSTCYKRKPNTEGYVLPRCCVNYYLEGVICKECPSGYFGVNCSIVCPWPSYGRFCQSLCECTQERCNRINGCYIPGPRTSIKSERPTTMTEHNRQNSNFVETTTNSIDPLAEDIQTTESQQKTTGAGKENSKFLKSLILYGLPCFVSVVVIFILLLIIKKKMVCSKNENRTDEKTNNRLNDMDDGYEMIDDRLINPNIIPQQESGRITTSAISVENNDTVRREYFQPISDNDLPSSNVYSYAGNGVPFVRNNDYLQPISENDHSSSDSNVSIGDGVPVVRNNDYLHPYNPLLPDWQTFTPLYNDEEPNIKSDGYLHPYQPLQEKWLQRTHVYNTATEHTAADDKLLADQSIKDQKPEESVQNDMAEKSTFHE